MKDIPYLQNMGISPFPQIILKRSGRMGERQTLKSQTERDSLSWKQSDFRFENSFRQILN